MPPDDINDIAVRDATRDDLETIVRFNRALAEESEGLELEPETVRAGVRTLLSQPGYGRYFVAEWGGSAVGQILLTPEWSDWRNGRFLWIQSVWVEPHARRRGVFTRLYRHVEAIGREPGCCGLRLYVHTANRAAREAYARVGLIAPGYEVLETRDPLRE